MHVQFIPKLNAICPSTSKQAMELFIVCFKTHFRCLFCSSFIHLNTPVYFLSSLLSFNSTQFCYCCFFFGCVLALFFVPVSFWMKSPSDSSFRALLGVMIGLCCCCCFLYVNLCICISTTISISIIIIQSQCMPHLPIIAYLSLAFFLLKTLLNAHAFIYIRLVIGILDVIILVVFAAASAVSMLWLLSVFFTRTFFFPLFCSFSTSFFFTFSSCLHRSFILYEYVWQISMQMQE